MKMVNKDRTILQNKVGCRVCLKMLLPRKSFGINLLRFKYAYKHRKAKNTRERFKFPRQRKLEPTCEVLDPISSRGTGWSVVVPLNGSLELQARFARHYFCPCFPPLIANRKSPVSETLSRYREYDREPLL